MLNHICLITRSPDKVWLNFLNNFEKYIIHVVIDDNTKDYNEEKDTYKNIHFFQIDDSIPAAAGFKSSSIAPTPEKEFKQVIAWDKALYYFTHIIENYDNVWFFEDDVYFYDENVLLRIDNKYGQAALLSQHLHHPPESWADHIGIAENWWAWPRVRNIEPSADKYSLICICRMSRSLMQCLKLYTETYKTLYFIESMFVNECIKNNLLQISVEEFSTVHFDRVLEEPGNIYNIYHPHKNVNNHNLFRKNTCVGKCARPTCAYNVHFDINNNGGAYCCLMCKTDGKHGHICKRTLFYDMYL